MRLHLTLHRDAELWASGIEMLAEAIAVDSDGQAARVALPRTTMGFVLRPEKFANDYIRVQLEVEGLDPHPGWIVARVMVDYNGQPIGDGMYVQPIAFYVGDPTDWSSGLARYAQRGWPEAVDPKYRKPSVWTLGIRRSA